MEPEDLLQDALLKGLERDVIVRERSAGAQFVWLRRSMELELAYQRRRRRATTRPRRTTPLPWGQVEFWGEEQEPVSAPSHDGSRSLGDWDLLQAVLWSERVTLLLRDCFESSWETSGFLLGGRSRDATRRLHTRAVTRLRATDGLQG